MIRPAPDQSAGNRHPLLLADAQIGDRTAGQIVSRKIMASSKRLASFAAPDTRARRGAETGTEHVVELKIRHQIKLLKNEADAIGAKFVPVGRKQIKSFAQDRHFAPFGQGDPAQIEQGVFPCRWGRR